MEGPLTRSGDDNFTPEMAAAAREVERHNAQMQRQQVHIDEIKRLCHVRTD